MENKDKKEEKEMVEITCASCKEKVKIAFGVNTSLACNACGGAEVMFDQNVRIILITGDANWKAPIPIGKDEVFNSRPGIYNPIVMVRKGLGGKGAVKVFADAAKKKLGAGKETDTTKDKKEKKKDKKAKKAPSKDEE